MTKKKKESREQREEIQAKRVMRNIFIACIIIALLFIIGFSSMQ